MRSTQQRRQAAREDCARRRAIQRRQINICTGTAKRCAARTALIDFMGIGEPQVSLGRILSEVALQPRGWLWSGPKVWRKNRFVGAADHGFASCGLVAPASLELRPVEPALRREQGLSWSPADDRTVPFRRGFTSRATLGRWLNRFREPQANALALFDFQMHGSPVHMRMPRQSCARPDANSDRLGTLVALRGQAGLARSLAQHTTGRGTNAVIYQERHMGQSSSFPSGNHDLAEAMEIGGRQPGGLGHRHAGAIFTLNGRNT